MILKNINTHGNGTEPYNPSFKFFDENYLSHDWFSKRMCRKLRSVGAEKVLSLGIGHRIVSINIQNELNHYLKKHVIVECSQEIIKEFTEKFPLPDKVEIHCDFFETFQYNELFDAIEGGFVLEHVDDPVVVLNNIKKILKKDGTIYLVVPNAKSLHRRIGFEAGILKDYYQLSEYDLNLGHKRYFDLDSFTALVEFCGLKIHHIEGVYLKPLTGQQMGSLNLPPDIITGLYKVGVDMPDICNSIYLEAKRVYL